MTEPAHSLFSASAADRLFTCAGSVALSAGRPDRTSAYALEGTVAHHVLTCTARGQPSPVGDFAYETSEGVRVSNYEPVGAWCEVAQEMINHATSTLEWLRAQHGDLIAEWIDHRVNYAADLCVDEALAWGTLDYAALYRLGTETVLDNCDYKYGRGVAVDPEQNRQMKLYALGLVREIYAKGLPSPDRVRLIIAQPRVNPEPLVWETTIAELDAWALEEASKAAQTVLVAQQTYVANDAEWEAAFLRPSEKACRFCRARAVCPALRNAVTDTVFGSPPATPDEFIAPGVRHGSTVEWLAASLTAVDLVEDWCKAVREEAAARLESGKPVPGYKLVQGKRGARQWANDAAVVDLVREKFRLAVDEAFDLRIKSPTQMEKLAPKIGKDGKPAPLPPGAPKPALGPRQWKQLQALIVQPDGKLHVAPESDPRPAIVIAAAKDEFEPVPADAAFDINDIA